MFRETSAISPRASERDGQQNVSNEKMRGEMGLKKGRKTDGAEGEQKSRRGRGRRFMQENGGRSPKRKRKREGRWLAGSGVKSPKKGLRGRARARAAFNQADSQGPGRAREGGEGVWLHQTPIFSVMRKYPCAAGCCAGSFLQRGPPPNIYSARSDSASTPRCP